ncbi:MAG: hypothetical protein ACM368_12510, partial [Gemmatimonadota bacterium]
MTAHFVGEYKAFAGNGAAGAPLWLRELRERGIARFTEVGFPSTRQEAWRFTNVQPIADTPFTLSSARWEVGTVPAGVVVAPLREAIERWPELVRAHLARHAQPDANPFTALSTAFLADG